MFNSPSVCDRCHIECWCAIVEWLNFTGEIFCFPEWCYQGELALDGKEVNIMSHDYLAVRSYRSVEEALSEVERECNVRHRCFPRWIGDGRVNKVDAQDRLDRLATARHVLDYILSKPELLEVVNAELGIAITKMLDTAKGV